jgi:hypothetical protein
MTSVLSFKAIKTIERGIREGRCMTVIPDAKGVARVVESDEFLSKDESDALLKSVAQPTPGTFLDMFIWEFADGSVQRFAEKVGYHPNRVSALKSTTRGISSRLLRRMIEAYELGQKQRKFWSKNLLGL